MSKSQKGVLLALLVAAAAAAWFWFSRPEPQELILYGNVDQRQIELAFIDAERIAEVLVQEGEEVRPGQVLARQETRRLRDKIAVLEAQVVSSEAVLTRLKNGTRPEEVDQAKAAVAAARAEAAFARQQYDRYNGIWRQSNGTAVSKQDLDAMRMRLNTAAAALNQEEKKLVLAELGPRWEDIAEAEAVLLATKRSLEELRNKVEDAELKSPVLSVVRSRLLEPGDMASPQKAVFSLAVLSPKWIRAYVSEPDLGRIRYGMKVSVYTDSRPDQGIPGTLGFISSVAEFTPKTVQTPELRTSLVYEIRVYVQDPEDRLRLGMPATVIFSGTD